MRQVTAVAMTSMRPAMSSSPVTEPPPGDAVDGPRPVRLHLRPQKYLGLSRGARRARPPAEILPAGLVLGESCSPYPEPGRRARGRFRRCRRSVPGRPAAFAPATRPILFAVGPSGTQAGLRYQVCCFGAVTGSVNAIQVRLRISVRPDRPGAPDFHSGFGGHRGVRSIPVAATINRRSVSSRFAPRV